MNNNNNDNTDKCSDFYKLPPIDIDEEDYLCKEKEEPIYSKYSDSKVFIVKLSNFLSAAYPKFKDNFKYIVSFPFSLISNLTAFLTAKSS